MEKLAKQIGRILAICGGITFMLSLIYIIVIRNVKAVEDIGINHFTPNKGFLLGILSGGISICLIILGVVLIIISKKIPDPPRINIERGLKEGYRRFTSLR